MEDNILAAATCNSLSSVAGIPSGRCLPFGLAVLCGQLLGAITIADDRHNGFWRRPSVV